MIGVVQTLAAVCRDTDDVLDPDPEPPGKVDPRLDRETHTRHQRLLFTLDHVGRLVRGYSDPVAGAMNELLAIACVPDNTPGRSVDLLATHTWSHRFDAGLLCEPHDLVHFATLRGWFPDADSAGGVRPIAIPDTSEAQHNRITSLANP